METNLSQAKNSLLVRRGRWLCYNGRVVAESSKSGGERLRVFSGEGRAPVLLVHAGAWAIPEEEREAHRAGVEAALRVGFGVLDSGGSALDAVEQAVTVLEDDAALNAGTGSVLDRDGEVSLDAGIMEGGDLGAGAVAGVRTVRNPVRVARRVLEATSHVLLVGSGAERFAAREGFPEIAPEALVVPRERERLAQESPADTVGAVALDPDGRIAVAGSTGGTLGKIPGRAGDTPQVGAGFYADSRAGGAVATGWGEGAVRLGLCRAAISHLEAGSAPAEAAADLLLRLEARLSGRAGLLLLTPDGRFAGAHTTPCMAWGFLDGRGGGPPTVFLHSSLPKED